MNYLSFEKLIYHYESIENIKNNRPVFPVHATVSLGNYCNHKCLWCSVYQYQLDRAKLMDTKKLIHFLENASKEGMGAVTYVGNGEPTAHPDFGKLTESISKLGMEQGIFTNGYLLDRFFETILKNFTWLRISLDAGTPAVHEKMHDVSGHFEKIIHNIEHLVSHRKERMPTIGIQYAIHQDNIDDLQKCIAICSKIGVDYISIKPVFTRGSVGEKIEKNRLDPTELHNQVKKLKLEYERPDFSIYYRHYQIESSSAEKTVFEYDRCYAGFFNVSIYEDEKIIYCGPHRVPVGTMDDDMEKIKNGVQKISNSLNLAKCPAGCRYHEMNYLIDSVLNKDRFTQKLHMNFL